MMDISRRFAVGALVVTPLGRTAEVLGYDTDDRAELRYMDDKVSRPQDLRVAIADKLLKPLPNA